MGVLARPEAAENANFGRGKCQVRNRAVHESFSMQICKSHLYIATKLCFLIQPIQPSYYFGHITINDSEF